MQLSRRLVVVPAIVLLWVSRIYAEAAPAGPLAAAIRILPDTSYLALDSAGRAANVREASTPVRVEVSGASVRTLQRVGVYACMESEEAMAVGGRSSALAGANLRIRNAQGEWSELEPLVELAGRRGVRIATLNGSSARILLEVQLRVPAGQSPGTYQGTLTLVAQEEE